MRRNVWMWSWMEKIPNFPIQLENFQRSQSRYIYIYFFMQHECKHDHRHLLGPWCFLVGTTILSFSLQMHWQAEFGTVAGTLLACLGLTGFLTSLLPTLFTAPGVAWTWPVPTPSVVFLSASSCLSELSSPSISKPGMSPMNWSDSLSPQTGSTRFTFEKWLFC